MRYHIISNIENNKKQRSIWVKMNIDKTFVLCILSILTYGTLVMWSASGQDIDIIERRIYQIFIGLCVMIAMAQIPPRLYEIWALYLYILCILLLILVDAYGQISKGAQRWLDLGFLRFQPSEIAKIAVPLVVARFINRDVCPPSIKNTCIALTLILMPTLLVAIQPDLGTSILIAASGLFILFLAGLSWRLILATIISVAAFIPIFWVFLMRDYQQDRVMMLLNPERDPLGAGYHIIQSKIAIGSGGFSGKGWLHGTQSQLEFLPERHTDFIFAVIAEELGLIGVLILLALYLLTIIRGLMIAVKAQTTFGRVIVGDLMLILFVYIFVNIGMVSGILPVVGVPLPLISYGGSALIVLMAGFGIVMSIHAHRKILSKNL
ncbi:Rod shape-determining protein RodA [Candidatus Profftia tarda]|uniref:Peptidoglycan glycosyltransferase MrdB n=2 Tax=Candidatus Profftia tarda TaxID=1177216 RepID=A0A8E4GHV0_9ENTR|nr:Rod shape-determining protein RodA [Candidatus Profftia tarda]